MARPDRVEGGRNGRVIVAPSLLAARYERFAEEAAAAERAGGDWLHIDVMDGHFVDNITFGPGVVAAVRPATTLPLDVHLMIARPDRYLDRFIAAGARSVTVHVEAPHDVSQTLGRIRAAGCLAGLALNPATPLQRAEPWLGHIDILLIMTVNPGFGGQTFLTETLEKVRGAARRRAERGADFLIEVDGGINVETARWSRESGADVLVAGTSVFGVGDMAGAVAALRG